MPSQEGSPPPDRRDEAPPRYTPTSLAEILEKVAAVRAAKAAARRHRYAWAGLLLASLALAGARLIHPVHFRHAHLTHFRHGRHHAHRRACTGQARGFSG